MCAWGGGGGHHQQLGAVAGRPGAGVPLAHGHVPVTSYPSGLCVCVGGGGGGGGAMGLN